MPRGRKPIPAAQRRLMGNPSKRPIIELTPMPAEIPEPPRKLSKRAAEHWERNAHLLHDAKLLTRLDGDALADYCEARESYERMHRQLRRGDFVRDKQGVIRCHPAWSVIFKLDAAIKWFQSEYGLTGSARMKVKNNVLQPELAKNPFDEFMQQKDTA